MVFFIAMKKTTIWARSEILQPAIGNKQIHVSLATIRGDLKKGFRVLRKYSYAKNDGAHMMSVAIKNKQEHSKQTHKPWGDKARAEEEQEKGREESQWPQPATSLTPGSY